MKKIITILILGAFVISASCKKKSASAGTDPRVPPDMSFKTTSAYVYKDTTLHKQDTILVGVIMTKTEDNLTSFNASVSYDGSSTTNTFFNYHLSSSEYAGYTKDLYYYCRNQTGIELLTFTVVDRDGNITKKSIKLTVN
jgi:hypothetical protein